MNSFAAPVRIPVGHGQGHEQTASQAMLLAMVLFFTLDLWTHSSGVPDIVATTDPFKNHTRCCDTNHVSGTSMHTTNRTTKKGNESYMNHRRLFHEISSVCPGAAEYLSSQSEPAIFRVSVSDCRRPGYDPRSRHGVVYGVCNDSTTFCQFLVQVPRGMIVCAQIKSLSHVCTHDWVTHLANSWPLSTVNPGGRMSLRCRSEVKNAYLSTSDEMFVSHYHSPMLQILFEPVLCTLHIVHTSDVNGYVVPLAPEGFSLQRINIIGTLNVPREHTVLISFQIFRIRTLCFSAIFLQSWGGGNMSIEENERIADDDKTIRFIYNTKYVKIRVALFNEIPKYFNISCMKMLFSFLPDHEEPKQLDSELFNCSVAHYWRFQQHLDCNMKVQCEDGRDEAGHCPYSSPACRGWVASQNKCYTKIYTRKHIHPVTAIDQCLKHGWKPATVKTNQEFTDFEQLFHGHDMLLIGLHWRMRDVPFMYRGLYIWSDRTVLYNANHISFKHVSKRPNLYNTLHRCVCPICDCSKRRGEVRGVLGRTSNVACEKYLPSERLLQNQTLELPAQKPPLPVTLLSHALAVCPEGHVTHTFLLCDPQSRCGQAFCTFSSGAAVFTEVLQSAQTAVHTNMFSCFSDDIMISYTLVCDFRQDCRYGFDELFCKHPPCETFTCTDGQCISTDKHCNNLPDCLDGSDESDCPLEFANENQILPMQQQVVINLDGKGHFRQHLISISEPCPDTHYRCRGEWLYCLPIYTRCNRIYDCVFQEDERDCEVTTCPGLYRCRGSNVCVHIDHLCDGWSQCPQRDDEWQCDMTCPAQCLCQGHAFLCSQPFSSHLFPELRYLDAHGSGMKPSDFGNITYYIIYLNLTRCSILNLSYMAFPNLQLLDLSMNKITNILLAVFLRLENLNVLSLKGNPLASTTGETSNLQQHALNRLDLSRTHLGALDSQIVRHFPGLQYVDVSFSPLRSVETGIFQRIPDLKVLDIRNNTIKKFPVDVFFGLKKLALVRSTDYRLCCKNVLPNISPATKCFASQHFLSSCEHLLHSEVYALSLWCMAIFATLGNIASSVGYCAEKTVLRRSRIIIFMSSLQCANFCMGIYMGVIATAHETFRGQYTHHEERWKDSVTCKVAGFLSLLSSEVSVLSIFLLTLDHFIVLYLPPRMCRFNCRSAAVACAVTWIVGIVMAAAPLLSGFSHLGRYGQTALCSVMLHDRHHLTHEFGFFHVILVFNFFIYLMVSVAQVIVCRAMPKYRVLIDCTNTSAHISVDLVFRIAATDAVSWFSVTASSFLAFADDAGSQNTSLFMAVMVLPLNSAVNPLLCLWHAVSCKQRQKQEKRVLHVLKSRKKCISQTAR